MLIKLSTGEVGEAAPFDKRLFDRSNPVKKVNRTFEWWETVI